MQIAFNPEEVDLSEGTVLLGLILPGFVKGCLAQGASPDEIIAGFGELISQTCAHVAASQKDT